jgi:hypothetical protein
MKLHYFATIALLSLAIGCSSSGKNPFLTTDTGVSEDTGGGDEDTGSEDCGGCLDSDGVCVDGDQADACGIDGRQCVECLEDQVCTEDGVCVDVPSCTPDNCDGCCDANGDCVSGDDDDACGRGGLACATCEQGTSCTEGECARSCGPDSCAGCCDDSGECLSGETDISCGLGGGACIDCMSIGAECNAGSCVEPGCAANCDGCCSDGECVNPPFDAQCGTGGAACMACGEGRSCIEGACTVDPASLWRVVIANGEVAMTNAEGGSWDGFNGLPDPYVNAIAVDPSDDERHENYTATIDNTFAPSWDEAPITVAARALFDGVTLEYIDDDLASNDMICTIELEFDEGSPEFNGRIQESECPDDPASLIRWKLEPQ